MNVAYTLISSVKLLAAPVWAEANKLSWPLGGTTYSASQD